MTDETALVNGFPNFDVSQRYIDALKEAAEFMKTHENEKELPEDIITKAIGPRPPYCDSPDSDAMIETMNSFNQYRKNVQLFIKRASILNS